MFETNTEVASRGGLYIWENLLGLHWLNSLPSRPIVAWIVNDSWNKAEKLFFFFMSPRRQMTYLWGEEGGQLFPTQCISVGSWGNTAHPSHLESSFDSSRFLCLSIPDRPTVAPDKGWTSGSGHLGLQTLLWLGLHCSSLASTGNPPTNLSVHFGPQLTPRWAKHSDNLTCCFLT